MLRKKETWSRLQHERRINTNIYLSYKHMVNQLWSQSSISGDRSWAQGAKTMDRLISTWNVIFFLPDLVGL
jgi:hypothetical protein